MNINQQSDDAFDVPFADGNIEDQWIASETQSENEVLLKSAMDKLSKRQREVLFLKYYQNLDYKEIAEVLEINYQSVRNLMFSGLKKLKDGFLIFIILNFF